jgi:hypothetical protein
MPKKQKIFNFGKLGRESSGEEELSVEDNIGDVNSQNIRINYEPGEKISIICHLIYLNVIDSNGNYLSNFSWENIEN